jgi:hypothetical protein
MRYVEIDGQIYRSVREACHNLNISYQKVKRLCRHFKRAEENPRIAIEWCLGKEKFIPTREQKTHKYLDDQRSSTERQQEFKSRCHELILKQF